MQPALVSNFPPTERDRAEAQIKASVVRAICLQAELIMQDPEIAALVRECRQTFPEPEIAVTSILAGTAGEAAGATWSFFRGTDLGTILSDPVVREQARIGRPVKSFIASGSMPPREVVMNEWGKLLPGAFYVLKIYAKVGTSFQVSDVQGPMGGLSNTFLSKLLPKVNQPISHHGLVASMERHSLLLPAQREILTTLQREGTLETTMESRSIV